MTPNIQQDVFKTLEEGERVEFELVETEKGLAAGNVHPDIPNSEETVDRIDLVSFQRRVNERRVYPGSFAGCTCLPNVPLYEVKAGLITMDQSGCYTLIRRTGLFLDALFVPDDFCSSGSRHESV